MIFDEIHGFFRHFIVVVALRRPSLHAFRAETQVDGLPRVSRLDSPSEWSLSMQPVGICSCGAPCGVECMVEGDVWCGGAVWDEVGWVCGAKHSSVMILFSWPAAPEMRSAEMWAANAGF